MNNQLTTNTLYKFENAKKIYFSRSKNKCFLIEKSKSKYISINLKLRDTNIYNKVTGILLFSSNK